MLDYKFWKNKKVFLTGHTGFKGSYMLVLLKLLGAQTKGYALNPPTSPSLYDILGGDNLCESAIGDIRDHDRLKSEMSKFSPDIVIHMAAQPLVIEGYKNPAETYQINVLGTVNVCEAIRNCKSVKAFLNVTTDKVYENANQTKGFCEDDKLGGYDPYSSSKACSELVTKCYRNSFFNPSKIDEHGCGVATARAGNVLGGGDFAKDRLIPDCVRAGLNKEKIIIRNGSSIRPWQHVIEPLVCYLLIVENLIKQGENYCTSFNIGPDIGNCRPVLEVLKAFCRLFGENLAYTETEPQTFYETSLLILDNSKIKEMLGFKPKYDLEKTISLIVEWTKAYRENKDMLLFTSQQIEKYLRD